MVLTGDAGLPWAAASSSESRYVAVLATFVAVGETETYYFLVRPSGG